MTVEISDARKEGRVITITAEDIGERWRSKFNRDRAGFGSREYNFVFDLDSKSDAKYVRGFLQDQPEVMEYAIERRGQTVGINLDLALQAIIGSAAEINRKYIDWDAA